MSAIKVIKRDNSKEKFDYQKIYNAVDNAFKQVRNEEMPESLKDKLWMTFNKENPRTESGRLIPLTVETIQDRIQNLLYNENYRDVYDAYIIYRYEHKVTRDYAESQKAFIEKYKQSDNNANATVDDNSNVSSKNIGTLNSEIHKADNIKTSRWMIMNGLKRWFPDFNHKQYVKDLESHICYKHDESSFAGPIAPYTYSAKEVVEVKYNNRHLLLPFDSLFDIIEEPEVLVDADNIVYQKMPDDLYVKTTNRDFVRVTHVTKKLRHRDLYRIKTSFGEDMVVTDNHPLITGDDVNDTTPAIDSLGCKQWKCDDSIEFDDIRSLDVAELINKGDVFDSFIRYDKHTMKRIWDINEEFGYFIGFFIGDGNYDNNTHYVRMSQKDSSILKRINDYLYRSTGLAGYIQYHQDRNMYTLEIRSRALFNMLRNYFGICDKAWNKTLPLNILETNRDFAKGVLEGLYDADGTSNYKQLWLKLSSRAAILQVSALMRYFGYSCGNGIQSIPFGGQTLYKTNYTLWTIGSSRTENSENFELSYKWKKLPESCSLKYISKGWANITNVQKITENDSFLNLNDYIYDITTDTREFCMNNIRVHNCVSATMYPFLTNGIRDLGGLSASPHNLDSFCGIYINWVFAMAGQFAGAVATPEFFICFDYFARKEWGDNYYEKPDVIITSGHCTRQMTIKKQIYQHFQQVVYSINQPSAARGMQSAFVNFAYFDKPFFMGMFEHFRFPDGSCTYWESVNWLQKEFMMWFNQERLRTVMTFPVETFALVYKDGKFVDQESADFVAEEYARGHSFFTYISDTVDSLSSCCFDGNEVIKLYDKDGNIFNTTLEDFVNYNNPIPDKNGTTALKDTYYIDSYNLSGDIEKTKITGVLKKEYTGAMYTFSTDDDQSITVTADHEIMVKNREGQILSMKAEDIANNIDLYQLVTV